MKKLFLIVACISFFGFVSFADNGSEEEFDFLLFAPDSSNRFVNHAQEMIHLDNIARYLLNRDLDAGQIHVHGYAAAAKNDIDPGGLSFDRAIFIIAELQRRGVKPYLFADPVAHGEVEIWGANEDETGRNLNRRVRIMIDGVYLPSYAYLTPEGETLASGRFPWGFFLIILAFLLLLAALLLAAKYKNKAAFGQTAAGAAASQRLVNLEEEIRRRAYEHYVERGCEEGFTDGDWYKAVPEICAQYEASGYSTYTDDNSWWARMYARTS